MPLMTLLRAVLYWLTAVYSRGQILQVKSFPNIFGSVKGKCTGKLETVSTRHHRHRELQVGSFKHVPLF